MVPPKENTEANADFPSATTCASGAETKHREPEGDCMVCFEELSRANYAEYCMHRQVADSSNSEDSCPWFPAKFCVDCIEELQATQFKRYCDSVANTTCAREQRTLLERGPPINLRDRLAFPESDDQEISALWYAKDNAEHSAKLKDSLEGEERQALWDDLRQFVIVDEDTEQPGEEQTSKPF
ncbi:hypothetical protein TGPRC2_217900 [Toxoplasma gondii TgCatPRC2]|uniref:Uncharacterized protein n=10 Tax=Toxoplasma gondii TaxID=5811 RepID=A0A125YN85_TOXGV|nr:hypothetical protein TGME49_217900 [Toxoplasma gondii ME49]EPR63776.1 hypothetical protein TGGT1_217900 [Toxoplasma gondii GT1]ESS34064.1 hypothetical protein TGVEG_217900 [Toxoplasma gondii VEG]KAF4638383.1 hypothetical protein TGRH88_059910 [Toxoplasma gondii]KFG47205.1 hypothetical protein TGDOM2_217900 [Toxoplasma gondii GAB2-2007-GAL-DOM2]KFG50520.1 hypothetical protein TGFOU_217900 [Toxoplasma gondii FOU]KFH12619.1 hypothetical protein TGVAND_217900 [Toxoplasma gondii VAND]KYF49023.|eukprot:XP_002371357.2 hypothetical protein TGME49_217900 [Toxoplasma gondii ME49]